MADVSRLLFLRHLRGTPTGYVVHQIRGRQRRAGVGSSFWYLPLRAVLSELPVDDRELPLLFHARTADFADVTVQATVTYRIADPELAALRLDFGIQPRTGRPTGRPLDQIATLLTELAQQPAIDLLAGVPLAEALHGGTAIIREAVAAALTNDERLADIGVAVVSSRVVAIRPEPELERALQMPTREAVQVEADRATHARRAQAVQQERAIAENELQNRIELAKQEESLVEQHGANERRRAELAATAALATARGQAEREAIAVRAAADRERETGEAQAAAVRARGLAEGDAEAARLAAYRDLPAEVLQTLALKELAANLPQVGQLTITPDVLTGALGRLLGGSAA